VTGLQNDGVQVKIVPLFVQEQNREFFSRMVGPDAFVSETSLEAPIESDELGLGGGTPWLYLGLATLLVLLLAANERLCARLVVLWKGKS
jgi:hypothetical protein